VLAQQLPQLAYLYAGATHRQHLNLYDLACVMHQRGRQESISICCSSKGPLLHVGAATLSCLLLMQLCVGCLQGEALPLRIRAQERVSGFDGELVSTDLPHAIGTPVVHQYAAAQHVPCMLSFDWVSDKFQ
jgi:hypothetical protein